MKKIKFALAITLCMLLVVACGDSKKESKKSTANTTNPTSTVAPTESVEPTVQPTEEVTPSPTPKFDIESFDKYQDISNIYVLNKHDGKDHIYYDVSALGENIVICGSDISQPNGTTNTFLLTLIDPRTGAEIKQVKDEVDKNFGIEVQFCRESVVFFEEDYARIKVFDKDLNLIVDEKSPLETGFYEYHSCDKAFPILAYSAFAGKLYSIDNNDGKLVSRAIDFPFTDVAISECSADGKFVYFVGKDKSGEEIVAAFNTETTEYTKCKYKANNGSAKCNKNGTFFYNIPMDKVYACVNGTKNYYYMLDGEAPALLQNDKFLDGRRDELVVNGITKRFQSYALYDSEGKFISFTKIPLGETCYGKEGGDYELFGRNACVTIDGCEYYLFTVVYNTGESYLILWDTSKTDEKYTDLVVAKSDEELKNLKDAFTKNKEETLSEAKKKADKLSEKYGVNFHIGDDMPDVISVYDLTKFYVPYKIIYVLDRLDSIMAMYPEGFFSQLATADHPGIDIYIGGTIIPNSEGALNHPSAFVDWSDDNFRMVLDQNYEIYYEDVFNHELSHIIDYKLQKEATPYYLFMDPTWARLNPEGIDYFNNYASMNNYSTNERFSEPGVSDAFLFAYSLTMPAEDKATIFGRASEAGLGVEGNGWDYLMNGKALEKKYRYYCEAIRATFDTTNWPEETFWEGGLSYKK